MHTQMLRWILLYMSAGAALHVLAAILYTGEISTYVTISFLVPLALSVLLVLGLRKKYQRLKLCPAEVAHFSLGELVSATLIIATLFAGVSRGIEPRAVPIAAVWMLVIAVGYVLGLVQASMRGQRTGKRRYLFAVLYALAVFGLCGLGVFLVITGVVAVVDPLEVGVFIRQFLDWKSGMQDNGGLLVLRIQMLISLPFAILSLVVFESFFPASTSLPFNPDIQEPDKPDGVRNLLTNLREHRQ